jgi:hypothetical protein
MSDVLHAVIDQADAEPDQLAAKDLDTELTYAELIDSAARLAAGLSARGVQGGGPSRAPSSELCGLRGGSAREPVDRGHLRTVGGDRPGISTDHDRRRLRPRQSWWRWMSPIPQETLAPHLVERRSSASVRFDVASLPNTLRHSRRRRGWRTRSTHPVPPAHRRGC